MLHALPLLVALVGQTAPLPAPGPEPPAKDRAQTLLKEGSALYKKADFSGALQKFQAAYAIYPSPKLQFNIAQANRELGRVVEAVEAFEIFLVQAPDSAPEIIAEARRSLAELKPKRAQVRVDAIAGAQVMVDGRALGVTPIARIIWVMPGPHRITVNHPSYQPASLDVAVSAGEIKTVAPPLLPVGATARVPAPAPPAAAPAAPAPPGTAALGTAAPGVDITASPAPQTGSGLARKPWYFWMAAAATIAFTAGAIVAGLSANSRFSELETSCGMTTMKCPESEIDTVKSRARIANVLWGLAGAAAVTTGVTFFVGDKEAGASIALRF